MVKNDEYTLLDDDPASRKTARSAEGLRLMNTPFRKSYFCPSPSALPLYDSRKDKVVMARLQDVYIQAHVVEKGRFAPLEMSNNGVCVAVHRCSQVRIGGLPEPFSQNETVAVGSILAVLSVTVILAYALYRNMTARRMDYDTME
ncbi:LAMP5 [Cordylochernes scorpioides]|uniref:LAMP5 n=1 Tax=Cordylochernes scorpioides TaxID=51811 RepID=A0ABY6L1F2_9ARAC|nr:LAMP5 [Cordylochernes scorpioides]